MNIINPELDYENLDKDKLLLKFIFMMKEEENLAGKFLREESKMEIENDPLYNILSCIEKHHDTQVVPMCSIIGSIAS